MTSLGLMLIPLARFAMAAVAATLGLVPAAVAARPDAARGTPVAVGRTAATVFVTPGGDDHRGCTIKRPCHSLDRAYRVARTGAVVSVARGTYPDQQIRAVPGRGPGAKVIFVGTGARFGEIRIQARDLELRNLSSDGWLVLQGATNVTLRNVKSTSSVFVNSASHVRVIGGSVDGRGQFWTNGSQIKSASSSAPPPRDIVFDHVTIRNFRRQPGSSFHVDCLHVMTGSGIVIRNSYFANCEAFDILFTVFLGPTPSGILIENNEFHCCGSGYYAVQLGSGHGERFRNVVIRANSSDKAFSMSADGGNQLANVRVSNNIAPSINGCARSGVRTDHNLLYARRVRCGHTDFRAAPGFVSRTNLHLRGTSRAINRGGPNTPSGDRDGKRRGKRPDIGAYERRR
jgi:hypothetical protein